MSRQNYRTWVPEERTIFYGTQRINKKALYLCVNVFSTKVLIGDTIFTSPTWRREGPPRYVIIRATRRSCHLQGKGITFFPQLFLSSETQGQSVGSGEKVGRKFSSTCKGAPGYRLSPNYFQKFKQMPAPDWAQKMLVLLCPIGEQFLLSSFREFVHDGYCLDHGCTKEMHAVRKISV